MPHAAPPSNFNLPTFIVAAVGAATGVASFAWNIVPVILSGAKIRVTIEYIYNVPSGPVFEVKAVNKRRGPMQIAEAGVRYYEPGTRHFTSLFFRRNITSDSDEIPKTVPGGHRGVWRIEASKLPTFEWNESSAVAVRGIVELGNGKHKLSRTLKLPAGALHDHPRVVSD